MDKLINTLSFLLKCTRIIGDLLLLLAIIFTITEKPLVSITLALLLIYSQLEENGKSQINIYTNKENQE